MLRPILLALLLILPATVRADDAPAAPAPPHTIEAPPAVMIYPFSPLGEVGTNQWIGQAIQQSLLVQVTQPNVLAWTIPATQPATATNDPTAAASKAGAGITVFGSFQISGDNIRVTGQIVHVASGKVIGGLSATGALRDLFQLEDTLGTQLRSVLQPLQSDVAEVPQVVDPDYQSPDYTIHYPSSDEDYSTPDYYPGYYTTPYFGTPFSSFFFFNVRHFHDHDHHFYGNMSNMNNRGGGFIRGSAGFAPQRSMGSVARPIAPMNSSGFSGGLRGGTAGHR